jgi:hypothetical protein
MEAAENQLAEAELNAKINKQRLALKLSAGAWKIENHPELAEGGAAYIEKIRSEADRS